MILSRLLIQLPLLDIHIKPNILFDQNYSNLEFKKSKIPIIQVQFPFLFNPQLRKVKSIQYDICINYNYKNKYCYRLFYQKISYSIETYEQYRLLPYPTYFTKINLKIITTIKIKIIKIDQQLEFYQFYFNSPQNLFLKPIILPKAQQNNSLIPCRKEYRMVLNFKNLEEQTYFVQVAQHLEQILKIVKSTKLRKIYGMYLHYLELFLENPKRIFMLIILVILNIIILQLKQELIETPKDQNTNGMQDKL